MVDNLDTILQHPQHGVDGGQVHAPVTGQVQVGHGACGVAVDLSRHLLLRQVVGSREGGSSIHIGSSPLPWLEDENFLIKTLVEVLPDNVGGKVVGDVGGKERGDAGVGNSEIFWKVVVHRLLPSVEPLPVYRAPGQEQLTVRVGAVHEGQLVGVVHHPRVGVGVDAGGQREHVGTGDVGLLVVPVEPVGGQVGQVGRHGEHQRGLTH